MDSPGKMPGVPTARMAVLPRRLLLERGWDGSDAGDVAPRSRPRDSPGLQPSYRARLAFLFLSPALFFAGVATSRSAIPEDFVKQSYELAPNANVSIRNTDGRIYIYGSDENKLEILAMRRAFSNERLEAIQIKVTIENNTAVIDTIYPPASGTSFLADRSGTVDYTIILPQHCTLSEVKLANGEIMISGMRGEQINAHLDRGLMYLRNCFSAVRARLGQGRMNVRYSWWETSAFSLAAEVEKGDLRLAVIRGAAVHLDATSVDGRILNYFAPQPQDISRLDQQFGGESRVKFELKATDGDIRIEPAY